MSLCMKLDLVNKNIDQKIKESVFVRCRTIKLVKDNAAVSFTRYPYCLKHFESLPTTTFAVTITSALVNQKHNSNLLHSFYIHPKHNGLHHYHHFLRRCYFPLQGGELREEEKKTNRYFVLPPILPIRA
ncbi:unnamed protein product [Lactuca saligna]|uniref:Uncharacterized protein n=1 Tax=Lactuca saligna TaxID=75948 RepID=A0AA35ZUQ7_LACSI|nr:unnamed protein product [Lactuca saligna]